jgi:hypothetical protein
MRAPAGKAGARVQASERKEGKREKKKRSREQSADAAQRLTQQTAAREAASPAQRSNATPRGRARATGSSAEPRSAAVADVGPSPRMLAKARRRYFTAAENAFTLDAAHDMLVCFVLSEERELALPPVNDAQRCGLRALAAIFRLHMASRGPKRQREYSVKKTRRLVGVLPAGQAEVSVARLLAAKTDCKREMQDVCDRVLLQAGVESRRADKRARNSDAGRKLLKAQKRAANEGGGREASKPPQPPEPPPAPLLPRLTWFIDRGGGASQTPAQTLA